MRNFVEPGHFIDHDSTDIFCGICWRLSDPETEEVVRVKRKCSHLDSNGNKKVTEMKIIRIYRMKLVRDEEERYRKARAGELV